MKFYYSKNFKIEIINNIVQITVYCEFADFDIVNEGILSRNELCEGKTYPLFSDIRTLKSSTREARERMAAKDAGIGVSAVAILINSKAQRIIYNFFNSIYKAPAPTRLFTNKEKALKWLEQYKTIE